MKAIVYSSAAGHTERYALALSEMTGLPAIPVRRIGRRLSRGDEIVFLGWVMAGVIDSYMHMYNTYEVRVLCPVGLLPYSDFVKETLEDHNIIPDEIATFYLRGGFEMKRLHGLKRWMARSFRVSMEMDFEDNETKESGELFELMQGSPDFFDRASLEPVAEKIRELQNSTEKELTTP